MNLQPPFWSCFLVATLAATMSAQTAKPSFEVASVRKRTEPLVMRGFVNPNVRDKGVFTMPSTTVAGLIQYAYDIRDYQMIGAPEWVGKDLFEINARAVSTETPPEQMRLMVQSLLEDRFKLVVRWDQREMAYFALLPAHADQHLGPALTCGAVGAAAARRHGLGQRHDDERRDRRPAIWRPEGKRLRPRLR